MAEITTEAQNSEAQTSEAENITEAQSSWGQNVLEPIQASFSKYLMSIMSINLLLNLDHCRRLVHAE